MPLVSLIFMCFQSVEAGGSLDLESLVSELASCLNSLSENVASSASDDEHENDVTLNARDDEENDVIQVLDEILKFLSSPQIDQVLLFFHLFDSQKYILYGFNFDLNLWIFPPNSMVLQDVIDALSFELPKVISKFAGLSNRCLELAEEIVDRFVEACNPRDMLPVLCEVC